MAEQLGFDLPTRPALGRADFLVAPSNAFAVTMIENWQEWTGGKLLLTGPEGAGKTHLVHVWASLSGATVIAANSLSKTSVPQLAQACVAVEDLPETAGNHEAQTALFHLHNMVLAEGHQLLLTGVGAPQSWGLELPDLVSRIRGAASARLDPPDDALLTAVLIKLFSDRQLMPKPEVIAYLTKRIDRSFSAARDIVERLDSASLAQKRPITRSLAASVLDNQTPSAR